MTYTQYQQQQYGGYQQQQQPQQPQQIMPLTQNEILMKKQRDITLFNQIVELPLTTVKGSETMAQVLMNIANNDTTTMLYVLFAMIIGKNLAIHIRQQKINSLVERIMPLKQRAENASYIEALSLKYNNYKQHLESMIPDDDEDLEGYEDDEDEVSTKQTLPTQMMGPMGQTIHHVASTNMHHSGKDSIQGVQLNGPQQTLVFSTMKQINQAPQQQFLPQRSQQEQEQQPQQQLPQLQQQTITLPQFQQNPNLPKPLFDYQPINIQLNLQNPQQIQQIQQPPYTEEKEPKLTPSQQLDLIKQSNKGVKTAMLETMQQPVKIDLGPMTKTPQNNDTLLKMQRMTRKYSQQSDHTFYTDKKENLKQSMKRQPPNTKHGKSFSRSMSQSEIIPSRKIENMRALDIGISRGNTRQEQTTPTKEKKKSSLSGSIGDDCTLEMMKNERKKEDDEYEKENQLLLLEKARKEAKPTKVLATLNIQSLVHYIQQQIPDFHEFKGFTFKYKQQYQRPYTSITVFDDMTGDSNISLIILTNRTLIVTFTKEPLPTVQQQEFFTSNDFCIYELEKAGLPVYHKWTNGSEKSFLFLPGEQKFIVSAYRAFKVEYSQIQFYSTQYLKDQNGIPGRLGKDDTKEVIDKLAIVKWK